MSEEQTEKKGWFRRLKDGLSKSTSAITTGITDIFTKRKLDAETLDELEDLLITSDMGLPLATRVREALAGTRMDKEVSVEEVKAVLAEEVGKTLAPAEVPLTTPDTKPVVLLMVGVNGTGKTTTIGKLARIFKAEGKSVMLAAADTFRAAAMEQLAVWGERNNVPVVTGAVGSDPASVAFEGVKQAIDTGTDILMIDTAGRLQNRRELMDELQKVVRVIERKLDGAPHHTLLVLDATTGQNALSQVQVFQEAVNVSGLIMTKLDGSAKGGVLVACVDKTGLPVHYIGFGEGIEDLKPFTASAFATSLAGIAESSFELAEKEATDA